MGLGQYDSLGEYCDPHTASSVFLIITKICTQANFVIRNTCRSEQSQKYHRFMAAVNILTEYFLLSEPHQEHKIHKH